MAIGSFWQFDATKVLIIHPRVWAGRMLSGFRKGEAKEPPVSQFSGAAVGRSRPAELRWGRSGWQSGVEHGRPSGSSYGCFSASVTASGSRRRNLLSWLWRPILPLGPRAWVRSKYTETWIVILGGEFPGGRHDSPFQYSCLKSNQKTQATVHGSKKLGMTEHRCFILLTVYF